MHRQSLALVHSVVCMHVAHIHTMHVLYYISACAHVIVYELYVHADALEESLQSQGLDTVELIE